MRPICGLVPFLVVSYAVFPGVAAAESCGDLLIVLDRSGSMNLCQIDGKSKWETAKKAIKAVTTEFPDMPMGLEVFPDTTAMCSNAEGCNIGRVVIDIAPDGASRISSYLDTGPVACGGTPTGDSMIVAKGYAGWIPGKTHFVLLITDGQPTCRDDNEGTCVGMGDKECLNPTKVFTSIDDLRTRGIHTFVVGFEGMGMLAGWNPALGPDPVCTMPFNPATLDRAAEAGGEAKPTSPKYFSATNEASLLAALRSIGEKVSSGGTAGGGMACVVGARDAGAGGSGGGAGGSGGGAGGSGGGAGGSGGGAGGSGGGAGGQGGGGPDGGNPASGVRPSAPGCGCTVSGTADAPLSAAALGLAAGFSHLRRRRR